MTLAANPWLTSVAVPPIAEAQGWIEGRVFPADKPLIDVCQAVPGYAPPDQLVAFMADALKNPSTHRYTDIEGLADLRAALAADIHRVYAGNVTAANVLITAGCNQAYCLSTAALAKAGDEIILPLPYYFNYQMWLEMIGVTPRHVRFRPEAGGQPDLNEIRGLINPKTKALVLISPNNPTGTVYPPEYLSAALRLCRETGIALILDETYRDFMPHDAAPHGLFGEKGWEQNLLHLYSFSKVFCLTGHRVGAIVGDPKLLDQIGKSMDCVAICAPRLGQIAAQRGLEALHDWRGGNTRLMRDRLAALQKAFARNDLGYEVVSAGAYFAYVKHPHQGRNATDVAKRLADKQNLLALPGSMFGPGQESFLRVAFANVDADRMPEIAARLAADAASAW
ncbi:aminotransferase [Dongia rigui]|uniref:aspartate transaminase n=1 Tax=Dongia rigui TaxID=940149 RepID=A0ABU5DTX5_9PROT|nr:aminotransferase [Dongia rigui]MDY0870658.1 aminotransferase [Dongia rigui]